MVGGDDMTKVIPKDKLDDLLGKLAAADFELYGPVDENGLTFFRKIEGNPKLDFENSAKPPKEVFFPQTEKMFDLKADGHRFVGAVEPRGRFMLRLL